MKQIHRLGLIFLIVASVTMLSGLIGLGHINARFSNQQFITFHDPAGDALHGTYLPGDQPIGVLMLEGFGSDQIAMRPAAAAFQEAGAHVFTFDFSGHGRSSGALGFDNASTNRLARQTLSAKAVFQSLSGLSPDQMLYFGHSLGARVAMQSAVLDPAPPRALVLLGTQINLGTNVQAEFFTGTSDAELAWVQSLDAHTPAADVLLFSGAWDDILTPPAAQALFNRITRGSTQAEPGFVRQQTILPFLLHNYEIYSVRLLNQAFSQLDELGILSLEQPVSLSGYYHFGAMTLLGLLGALVSAPIYLTHAKPSAPKPPSSVKILRLKPFLRAKLLLWLAAVPAAIIITGAFFLIPLGLPVFNMIYVGFIGGYGVVMLILYRAGKLPGTDGRMRIKQTAMDDVPSALHTALGLLLWAAIVMACVIFTRSGWFFVIAPNQRLAWLALFTPVTALGFWIGEQEQHMLETFRHESGRRLRGTNLILALISLTPFFLYTLLMGVLGSLSGLIGGLHGLLILAIVLLTGRVLAPFFRQAWVITLLQVLLLYALLLPQGVLFAF